DLREFGGDLAGPGLMLVGDTHCPRGGQGPPLSHLRVYTSSMIMSRAGAPPLPARRSAGDLIASWRPSSVSLRAADFARAVVTGAAPDSRERAKSLLQSAGKLADYAIGC